jgi:hypothetical protein
VTEPDHNEPEPDDHHDQHEPRTTYDGAPAQPPDALSVGDPQVRAAVRRLDDVADLPPADHVEVYESVHSSLQESLAQASRQADELPIDRSPPS